MITEYLMLHVYWIWIFYISIGTYYTAIGISWFFNTKLHKKLLNTSNFLPWLLNGAMLGNIFIIFPLSAFGTAQLFVEAGLSGFFVILILLVMLLVGTFVKGVANFRRKYILKEY